MAIGIWRRIKIRLIIYLFRIIAKYRQRTAAKRDLLLCDDIEPQRVRIPSRDKGRDITAYLYYPPGTSGGAAASDKRPVLVNWHGSGFVLPSLGSDRVFCAQVARETGIVVLDADYRKAPENPFPAAVHDVEDTLRWVASRPEEFDTSRVAVSGFSAGGNLALVAASSLRQGLLQQSPPATATGGVQIKAVVAVYPVTDISIDAASKQVPHPVRPIPAHIAAMFDDCYTPDPAQRTDPRASPSLAELSLFPETVVIITAGGDTLSPEAMALASRLEETNRTVVNRTLPGMHHGFDKACTEGSEAAQNRAIAYSLMIRSLQDALKI